MTIVSFYIHSVQSYNDATAPWYDTRFRYLYASMNARLPYMEQPAALSFFLHSVTVPVTTFRFPCLRIEI